MKVNVELNPDLKELLVNILAPEKSQELDALLARIEPPEETTLLGFQNGCAVPLNPDDVLRFYGEEKEVRAQTADGVVYAVRRRLYELEGRYAARRFVRISNSELVNWNRVEALDLSLAGTIRVTLAGGVVTYVSRRCVKRIKEVLGL